MTGTTPDSWSLLNAIQAADDQANALFEAAFQDDSTLDVLAQGWRQWAAFRATVPPQLRLNDPGAADLGRGGEHPGGLGDDYPADMAEATRHGWSAAARGLAWQQSMVPFGFAQARELHGLAGELDAAPAPAFAPTPTEVVWSDGGLNLRRVHTRGEVTGSPILLISSLINRWYVLDLLEGRSFLQMLAGLGRPLYLAQWLPPSEAADERSLSELCAGPLTAALNEVCAAHDADKANVIGYCMGGTLATMLAARHPERVQRLATLCGPVDFAKGGLFTRWLSRRFLDVGLVASAHERIPAALVHLPFWSLRPTIKTSKLVRLARSFTRPGYLERFLALEIWNHDNVDMARGVFRSWAGDLYQDNALARGQVIIDGELAAPARITCPVLAISGSRDTITPPESVEALVDLAGSESATVLRLDGSHTGLLTDGRHLASAAAALATWLETTP